MGRQEISDAVVLGVVIILTAAAVFFLTGFFILREIGFEVFR